MATKIQSVANSGFVDHLDLVVSALTTGNVLFLSAWCQETKTLTPSASEVTFTLVEGRVNNSSGSFDIGLYQWIGVVNTGGATTVTITEGAGAVIHGIVEEWSGPTGSIDKHTTGETTVAGGSHNVTAGVTTTSADELLVATLGDTGSVSSITAGSGYTKDTAETGQLAMMYKVVAATASYDAPWTSLANDGTVTILGTFPLTAAGGGIKLTQLERGVRGSYRGQPGRV
jgi:hypothetical protein